MISVSRVMRNGKHGTKTGGFRCSNEKDLGGSFEVMLNSFVGKCSRIKAELLDMFRCYGWRRCCSLESFYNFRQRKVIVGMGFDCVCPPISLYSLFSFPKKKKLLLSSYGMGKRARANSHSYTIRRCLAKRTSKQLFSTSYEKSGMRLIKPPAYTVGKRAPWQ